LDTKSQKALNDYYPFRNRKKINLIGKINEQNAHDDGNDGGKEQKRCGNALKC